MTQEVIKKVFDPYTQTSRLGTEGEKGTGFGMPLVKGFTEKLGGTILITSSTVEEDSVNYVIVANPFRSTLNY